MAPIGLSALGTPVLALQNHAIKSVLRQTFRRAIWSSGLGFQLYLGLAFIEEIDIHLDPAFTMTVCGPLMTSLCQRYTLMAGVFSALLALVLMASVTLALQASFYWAWGTGWKDWWVGRAAYWMWGPIEEDNYEVDLEKGVEPSTTLEQSVESPKLVVVQPAPYSDMAPPVESPKPFMVQPTPYPDAERVSIEKEKKRRPSPPPQLPPGQMQKIYPQIMQGYASGPNVMGPSPSYPPMQPHHIQPGQQPAHMGLTAQPPKRVIRRRFSSAMTRVEFPRTASLAPHAELYESKSKAIAALYDYPLGELSNFCTYDPERHVLTAYEAEASIPTPAELRQAGLEMLWLPIQSVKKKEEMHDITGYLEEIQRGGERLV